MAGLYLWRCDAGVSTTTVDRSDAAVDDGLLIQGITSSSILEGGGEGQAERKAE
jgi:hypothetical protein